MSYYSDEGATAEDSQGNNITSYITKIVQKYNADTSSWDTIAEINDPHANPWDVPYISRQEGDKYKIIYNVKDINNVAAESKTRLINILTPQPEYTPGGVAPAYTNGAPENSAIPLHNNIVALNFGGLLSDLQGSANPWWHYGDGTYGGPPYETEHEFFMRHISSYFTKELWDFMRLPTLEIEVKACDAWTDIHYTSSGSSSQIHRQNRYRLKDTATSEYWDWGSQKNFDYGMANGQWSSFVPFGSNASLSSFTLDPNSATYTDIRAGLKTMADGGGEFVYNNNDTEQALWVNILNSAFAGMDGGANIGMGGTYNSETNTFTVSTPSMASYVAQDPYYGGTLPTTYADMWSSPQAIASAAVLEGIPAQQVSTYNSPAGFPFSMTAFYPNLTTYADVEGGRSGHAWMMAWIAYLGAGMYYALSEPPSPNLSEFFPEGSTQYRYPVPYQKSAEAPQMGAKSIKGPDTSLIVEHASLDHYDEHGVPINNDFLTYTEGGATSWLVPIVGDFWYLSDGSTSRVKTDAPDTYICTYLPPYFT
jgi:hypothetical protein